MIKIMQDFNNELLGRREVKILVEAEKNPGLEEAKKIIVDNFNVETEKIVVKALKSIFGRNHFFIEALIYNSIEKKNMVETKPKSKKEAVK